MELISDGTLLDSGFREPYSIQKPNNKQRPPPTTKYMKKNYCIFVQHFTPLLFCWIDPPLDCVSASFCSIQVTRDSEAVDSRTCVFWDKTDLGGRWSSEGCRREYNPDINRIRCVCDHLTSFAVLMVHYYFFSCHLISLKKTRMVNSWKK